MANCLYISCALLYNGDEPSINTYSSILELLPTNLTMSTTIVVVAHGNTRSGSFSNPNIKIITKSEHTLSFDEAKSYLGGKSFPEYQSSSLGDYGMLSDSDCQAIFGKVPGKGPGLVDTGLKIPNRQYAIYALRGEPNVSFAEMGVRAGRMKATFILVACR